MSYSRKEQIVHVSDSDKSDHREPNSRHEHVSLVVRLNNKFKQNKDTNVVSNKDEEAMIINGWTVGKDCGVLCPDVPREAINYHRVIQTKKHPSVEVTKGKKFVACYILIKRGITEIKKLSRIVRE